MCKSTGKSNAQQEVSFLNQKTRDMNALNLKMNFDSLYDTSVTITYN